MPKRCSKCQLIYAHPEQEFYRDKRNRDGLASACRRCKIKSQTKYIQRPEVRAKRNARFKAYYAHNIERERARKRVYSMTRYHQRKRRHVRWAITLYRLNKRVL